MKLSSCLTVPIIGVLVGLLLLSQANCDDELSIVVRGLRDRYGNTKGLTADYTREAISKTMALLGTPERHDTAEGKLYFKPPHFLRLEQARPQEELLLTDGVTLWWYLPLKNEAHKYSAKKFGQELGLLSDILTGLEDTKNSFRLSLEVKPETSPYHLILQPDPPWEEVDRLKVIIRRADQAIQKVEIYNKIGGLTRFILTKSEKQDQLSSELFSFSPPQGVEIIKED